MDQPAEHEDRRGRIFLSRKINKPALFMLAGLIAFIATLGVIYVRLHPSVPGKLQTAAKSVSFPLYYPSVLPAGYKLDQASVSYTGNVVLFSLYNVANGATISVTEQPVPNATIDLEAFYHNQFDIFHPLTVPMGKGIFGKDVQNSTVIISSDKTWVIIRAPLTAGDQIRSVATKLSRIP